MHGFISLINFSWKNCFDEDTGLSCFKSRFGHEVNLDHFHPQLVHNCKSCDKLASDYFTADDLDLSSFRPSDISRTFFCDVEVIMVLF